MSLWHDDSELFQTIRRELYTAVVGDIMDKLGLLTRFLPPQVRPLRDDMIAIGRAMPVLETDFFAGNSPSGNNPLLDRPFGLMLEALDDLKANEIYICTGGSPRYALWRELMSTRALKCAAAGVVLNGYTRDTRGILALNFPTFSYGPYAQDQAPRGKVIDFRTSILFGEVEIACGDIIFGDVDGVCVIPQTAEEEVFEKALEKARGEKMVRKAIESGMSATDAFRKYAIM